MPFRAPKTQPIRILRSGFNPWRRLPVPIYVPRCGCLHSATPEVPLIDPWHNRCTTPFAAATAREGVLTLLEDGLPIWWKANGPGTPGPQGSDHNDDLHPCFESTWKRSSKSRRLPLIPRDEEHDASCSGITYRRTCRALLSRPLRSKAGTKPPSADSLAGYLSIRPPLEPGRCSRCLTYSN